MNKLFIKLINEKSLVFFFCEPDEQVGFQDREGIGTTFVKNSNKDRIMKCLSNASVQ